MREWTFTLSAILCFALQREMDIPFLGRAAAQHPLRPGYLAPTGPALAEPQGRIFSGKQRQTLGGNGMENLCVSTANPPIDRSECTLPTQLEQSLEHRYRRTAFSGLPTGQSFCGNPSGHHRMAIASGGHSFQQNHQGYLGQKSQNRAAFFLARKRHEIRPSHPFSIRIPLSFSMAESKTAIARKCRTYVAICRRVAFWPFRSGAPPPHPTRTHQTLGAGNRLYVLVSTIRQTLRIPQSPHRANWPNFKTLKP